MAISLPVLALYAVSAKMRGNRIEEQNKALADQEKARLDQENMSQYIIMSDQGVPMLAPKNWFMSKSFSPEKIIKYKIGGGEWQDWTPEKSANTVPLLYANNKFFTAEENPAEVKNAVQAGHRTINPDGTFTDQTWDKEFWFNQDKTNPPTPTEKQVYSFVWQGNTYGNLEGAGALTNQLKELNVPQDQWSSLTYLSTVVKTDSSDNQISISQPSAVSPFGTPTDPVFPEITIPYFVTDKQTDDGNRFEIEQSKWNLAEHGNKTGSFSKTTKNNELIKQTEVNPIEPSKLASALAESEMAYSVRIPEGNDQLQNEQPVLFGSKETKPTDRLKQVLNQVVNTPGGFKWLETNAANSTVKTFVNNAFADAVASYEEIIPLDTSVTSVKDTSGRLFIDHVSLEFPALLQFPGIKDRVTLYDEDKFAAMKNEKALQNENDSNDAASVIVPTPNVDQEGKPVNATDPTAPDYVYKSMLVSWPKSYTPLISNKIIPVLEAANPTGIMVGTSPAQRSDLVGVALASFISFENGPDGRPKLDRNNNPIVSADQPILHTLNKLSNTPYGLSPNISEFDALVEFVDPRKGKLNEDAPAFKLISRDFYDMTGGNIRKAHDVVFNMTPSSAGADRAMNDYFGFVGKNARDKFIEGQLNVRDASRRALNITDAVLQTYYQVDSSGNVLYDPTTGEPLLLEAAAVGNLLLFMDGATYLAGKGADLLNINFGDSSSKDQMMKAALQARSQLQGNPFGFTDDAAGLAAMEAEIEAISKLEDAAYARRRFYTVVLAYEVAAAIQGGTGGRTISDQDVAMIMGGLKQERVASPQTQVNALKGVRDMLDMFQFRADMLSSNDPKRRVSYITAEKLLNMGSDGVFRTGFSMSGVFNAISRSFATTPKSTDSIIDQIITVNPDVTRDTFNEFVLNNINSDLMYSGNTDRYTSLDEAKKALGDDMYKNLLDVATKNFVNKYTAGNK